IYCGHAEEKRRRKVQEFRGGFMMLEALQQAHSTPAREPAAKAISEAVYMEERQREQKTVRISDLPCLEERESVGREIAVREDGTLRSARRSRVVNKPRSPLVIEPGSRACEREVLSLAVEVGARHNLHR